MQRIMGCKGRPYPTPEQASTIDQTIGSCRYVYNQMLSRQQKMYARRGEHMSYIDMQNLLPGMKAYLPWLKKADSQALKYACRQLADSYQRFFKGQGGSPNFKSRKKSNDQSYTTTNGKHIHVLDNAVTQGGRAKDRVLLTLTQKSNAGRLLTGRRPVFCIWMPKRQSISHENGTSPKIDNRCYLRYIMNTI